MLEELRGVNNPMYKRRQPIRTIETLTSATASRLYSMMQLSVDSFLPGSSGRLIVRLQ